MTQKSVLIIRCGALGDLVYSTSVIDALKLEYGENTIIDFVCTPGTAGIFSNDKRINKVFHLRHKKTPIFLSSQKKEIIKYSKKNPYDLLINFEFGKQFKSLLKNIKSKNKIGAQLQDINIPTNFKHMVDINRYIFKDAVSQNVFDRSFPKLIGTPIDKINTKFNLEKKFIVISPSNSHQKRNILNYRAWENDKWIELIKELDKEIQVVIIGNKKEDDFFDKLKPYPINVIDLVAKTSLSELIGVIDGAVGVVSTDTGTAHIASAVNTQTFTLIGPTPSNQTGPYKTSSNKVNIISANLECSPCYKTVIMKNCKDNICMKQITTEMVYNSIKSADIL